MSTNLAIRKSQLESWGLIIKDCKESGLTVPVYCEQHDISRHAYYYWFKKLKESVYSQQPFVEIPSEHVRTHESDASCSAEVIEIRTGKVVIAVPIDVSKEVLSRILEVAGNAK